jgi:hypothetical protein
MNFWADLQYEPETGKFYRLKSARSVKAGDEAGCLNPSTQYWIIRVGGRSYRRGRLAWLYMTGRWPIAQIDHINGVKTDDRIENLREATNSQNALNKRRTRQNTSGFKGVTWHKRTRRWHAQINIGGKNKYIGSFRSPEEAHDAYWRAAQDGHGAFGRKE